ncbi:MULTISPECIES: PepSY domain-containing protein [Streptomyces]|uniref:Peptidase propeptide and YpeB domain protein n=1 Tax=Streptomyces venezuelae TaxID=54571 RepID=A0A5P2BN05_STRVZ|nr:MULTISPECIES: PepSY domain-containing protein [Streptomyces]NEA01444.1 PepSY domain-containing protein [Streptomyces sp. SID10116]MYY84250.1 peptidase propeptide and YpeB domain protein [Streptomyces sp. SID335]MYZ19056.1 peptidase propeptide and YpeB domain protein [Streptomyces sp. SID337]NDZ84569.1 PepSY domain-containing protein [Streptomyces sp. SID10115]NEB50494.1 PepSY domain-containing protein [Streptomyces sp. SID339]
MKRNIVIATVAAAALIGGGSAAAFATGGDDDSAASKSSVQLKDNDRKDQDDRDDRDDDRKDDHRDDAAEVTAADAIKAALADTSGTAVSAELDDEDGGLVWDVDILKGKTWHSVEVDPGTGKVLGSWVEKDDKDDAAEDAADAARVNSALKGASVTAADAAKAGADKGTVTSVDLDDDGTATAWNVETTGAKGAESEYGVDLKTGKVTADHSDDHDDRDGQDHDDDGSDD